MQGKTAKRLIALLVVVVMASVCMLTACSSTGTESSASSSTEASAETSADAANAEASEEAAASEANEESSEEASEEVADDPAMAEGDDQLPRDETLYFAGQQWGAINDWNPLSGNSNNAMALSGQPVARILIYETLMMYDPMSGDIHPLLANDFSWNDANTELTLTLNPDAKWSDGTPFTANDVAYTWATHVKYNTPRYGAYSPFIDTIEATDDSTVVIKCKLDEAGKPINYKYGEEFIISEWMMQQAYLEKVEQECGEDPEKVTTYAMDDLVATGPYKPYIANDQKVVFIRDENYWGQAESMWGKLPVPKYIAHTIFKDNAAGDTALRQGEVDVSQQFTSNVQDLWEKDGLDISTWYDDAPYQYPMTTPTCFFNCKRPGLDNATVRKAIAMAIDFDQIIASAMSGQCPDFKEYPRCVAPPNDTMREQYIDYSRLESLQFDGKDIDGANKLLDDAGIVDTDGDGIREIDGQNLSFKAECPSGWSDWNAAMEIVAAAGKDIGIQIETYFPEASVYYNDYTTHDFDITMQSPSMPSPLSPYNQAMFLMSKEYGDLPVDWSGNFGQYENEEVEQILKAIPQTTDEAQLKEYYTRLSEIFLTDVPCFGLMYRPGVFYTVNESVWTNYPAADDSRNIPPMDCTDGWGIAALYDLELVEG